MKKLLIHTYADEEASLNRKSKVIWGLILLSMLITGGLILWGILKMSLYLIGLLTATH